MTMSKLSIQNLSNLSIHQDYLKLYYGSSIYGLTNELSDEDFIILVLNENTKLPVLEDGVEVYTVQEFSNSLKEHSLKILEIYYHYFDLFYNKLEIGHTLNKDKLRRSVSATCSNSYVKAKKKIAQGDTYAGLKSYWHCIRILTMFSDLAQYKHLQPSKYKDKLEDIYFTIMSYKYSNSDTIFEDIDKLYKEHLTSLQHKFRLLSPLAIS